MAARSRGWLGASSPSSSAQQPVEDAHVVATLTRDRQALDMGQSNEVTESDVDVASHSWCSRCTCSCIITLFSVVHFQVPVNTNMSQRVCQLASSQTHLTPVRTMWGCTVKVGMVQRPHCVFLRCWSWSSASVGCGGGGPMMKPVQSGRTFFTTKESYSTGGRRSDIGDLNTSCSYECHRQNGCAP
jgi:hypothetical protein